MRRVPRYSIALILVILGSLVGISTVEAASGEESSFASRINSERSSRGMGTLAWAEDLAQVARRHSQRMASQNNLHHNPNLGSEVRGWKAVGENVGYGPGVDELHGAFMQSPSHRANILDADYTQIGIGTVWADGTLWVTEVFRQPSGSSGSSASGSSGSSGSGNVRPAPRQRSAPKKASTPRRPQPAAPPRRPVAAPVAPPQASSQPSDAASDLTRMMVANLLGADNPAVGSIYASELLLTPIALPSGGQAVGLSFQTFAQLAVRVNRQLLTPQPQGR